MLQRISSGNLLTVAWFASCLFAARMDGLGQEAPASKQSRPPVVVLEIENTLEVRRSGAAVWDPGRTNQILLPGDRLRTGERSRAVLRLSNLTLIRIGELSVLEVPEPEPTERIGLNIFKGIFYFFHRDKPGDFQIRTPTVSATVRGTEFNVEVAEDNKTVLALLDGEVEATNEFGSVQVRTGELVVAEAGRQPVKTAVINTANVIQWCLYYPTVPDLDELTLTPEEERILNESLAAYRRGNSLRALSHYPAERKPGSNAENIYLAALLLSVGQVSQAEDLIRSIPNEVSPQANADVSPLLGEALKRMVAATKFQKAEARFQPTLATEWLAESYYRQSQFNLGEALEAARKATEKSPNFGFAWARIPFNFFCRISEATRETSLNAFSFWIRS